MTTIAEIWGLLGAIASAWATFQAFQAKSKAAATDAVDTEADQAAAEAMSATTEQEAFDASAKIQDASSHS